MSWFRNSSLDPQGTECPLNGDNSSGAPNVSDEVTPQPTQTARVIIITATPEPAQTIAPTSTVEPTATTQPTATVEPPTPTPEPTPTPPQVTVQVETLNVREGPSQSYPVITQTHAGDMLSG